MHASLLLAVALCIPFTLATNILVSLHNSGLNARSHDPSHRSLEDHLAWVASLQDDVGGDSAKTPQAAGVARTFTIGTFIGYSGDFADSVISTITSAREVSSVSADTPVSGDGRWPNCTSHPLNPSLTAGTWGLGRISHFHNAPTASQAPALGHKTYRTLPAGHCPATTAYILDSGIDVAHAHFGGRARWGTTVNAAWESSDVCGHGTHVAGIVAAVQTRTQLVAVKVLEGINGACGGSWSGVIAGLEWALNDAGAARARAVIQLSLSGALNVVANAAVQAVVDAGVSVIVSAGNNGGDSCFRSPASEKTALTVGATTVDDRVWPPSAKGCCVDIWAPGEGVNSTLPGGLWGLKSGTSMAAPFVTGVMLYNKCRFGFDSPKKDREGVTDWRWVARNRLSGSRCTSDKPVSAEECTVGVGGGCADNKLLFNRGCDNLRYPGISPL